MVLLAEPVAIASVLSAPDRISLDVAAVLACRLMLRSHQPERDAEALERTGRGFVSRLSAQVYYDAAAILRDQIAIRDQVDRILLNVNCEEIAA